VDHYFGQPDTPLLVEADLLALRDALRRDRDMSARRSRRIRGASPTERLAPVPAMPNRGNRT
jgi:hypothetical protein